MSPQDTFCIVQVSSLTDTLMGKVKQDSQSTVRVSTDGVNCILSWNGSTPSELSSETTYTYAQILSLVNDTGGDWYEEPLGIPNP